MIAVWTALVALAAYRVWRLAALDTITEPLRAPLVRSDSRLATWLLDLLSCAWCLGFWLAGAVTYAVGAWQDWPWQAMLLVWWSSSAVVGLLEELQD